MSNELTMVTVRLFKRNVDRLRRDSKASGVPWQLRLRLLVDKALAKGTVSEKEVVLK